MKEQTMILTITQRECQVLNHLVVEAFKNAPLNKPQIVAVMTLNTKLNELEDTYGRDEQ